MKNPFLQTLALAGVLAIGLSSCGNAGDKTNDQSAANDADKQILGAGATFPFPLYSKMFSEYGKTSGIQTNYQSVGSGAGIKVRYR